jgi:hypothetical protein
LIDAIPAVAHSGRGRVRVLLIQPSVSTPLARRFIISAFLRVFGFSRMPRPPLSSAMNSTPFEFQQWVESGHSLKPPGCRQCANNRIKAIN